MTRVVTRLEWVPVDRCIALRRNPQFVSPHAMEALKASIARDGFLAPVLLRPHGTDDFEVVSGNHRVMAARELGMTHVAAVVAEIDDQAAGRIAVNMNTVHGDPTAELLAPFLAELDDETLVTVHLSEALLSEVATLDDELAQRLSELEPPEQWNRRADSAPLPDCTCPTCGKLHSSVRRED
jgi:ParB/RepB/Spo0J family partition protein